MWVLLKSLLAKWAILKLLLRALGSLGWLIPLALMLKAIGLPILILLAVLALPVLLVLAVLGLPFLLVVVVGGFLLTVTMWIVGIGLAALKIVIPIVLVYWLVKWAFRRGDGPSETPTTAAEAN